MATRRTTELVSFLHHVKWWWAVDAAIVEVLPEDAREPMFGRLADWTITVTDTKRGRWIGRCNGSFVRSIEVKEWAMDAGESFARSVVLHEVAHALDWETRGCSSHGAPWQRWARALSVKPAARYKLDAKAAELRVAAELKPVGRCDRCGYVFMRKRRFNRRSVLTHAGCGGHVLKYVSEATIRREIAERGK